MWSFFRKLQDRGAAYEPLISVRLYREHILHNLDVFRKKVTPRKIAPVLKSNAYGHGLLEVAHIINGAPDVAFLVVDSYYEARILQVRGITTPLLVLGYTKTENILSNPFDSVSFSVGSIDQLRELAEKAHTDITLHIKIDTGMHRQGISPHELSSAAQVCVGSAHLRVEGLCSHLADADGPDPTFTKKQITAWNACARQWREHFPHTTYYHLSATKGMRYEELIDANVARLGIGLYGIDPIGEVRELQPALEVTTEVTALHRVPKGDAVGYNVTWTASRDTHVATIPMGYFEGIDRRLSNKGCVEVAGKECPIIGRVSMNMTTVDVTDVPNVRVGSPVVVIAPDSTKQNSAVGMAKLSSTIPYDILVHVNPSLRRTVL